MKYSVDWLKSEVDSGKEFEYIGFWGKFQVTDLELKLSNFYEIPLTYQDPFNDDGIIHLNSSEQLFVLKKALLLDREDIAKEVIQNKNKHPNFYKQLGGSISINKSNVDLWNENCYRIMYESVYEKFTQSKELKEDLLSTGNAILVETSPFDKLWGIARGKYIAQSVIPSNLWKNVKTWKGKNYLGFALMELRDNLRE